MYIIGVGDKTKTLIPGVQKLLIRVREQFPKDAKPVLAIELTRERIQNYKMSKFKGAQAELFFNPLREFAKSIGFKVVPIDSQKYFKKYTELNKKEENLKERWRAKLL